MGAYDRRLRIRGEPLEDINIEHYAAAVATLLLGILQAPASKRRELPSDNTDEEAS